MFLLLGHDITRLIAIHILSYIINNCIERRCIPCRIGIAFKPMKSGAGKVLVMQEIMKRLIALAVAKPGMVIALTITLFFLIGCVMAAFATPWLPFQHKSILKNLGIRFCVWPVGGFLVVIVCAVTIAITAWCVGAGGGAISEGSKLIEVGPGLSRSPGFGIGGVVALFGGVILGFMLPIMLLPLCFYVVRDLSYHVAWKINDIEEFAAIIRSPESSSIQRHDSMWALVRNLLAIDVQRQSETIQTAVNALAAVSHGAIWAATLRACMQQRDQRDISEIEDGLRSDQPQHAAHAIACLHILASAIPPYTPLCDRPTDGIGRFCRMRWSSPQCARQLRAEFKWELPRFAEDPQAAATLANQIRTALENPLHDTFTMRTGGALLLLFEGVPLQESLAWIESQPNSRSSRHIAQILFEIRDMDGEKIDLEEVLPLSILRMDKTPPTDDRLARYMQSIYASYQRDATVGVPLLLLFCALIIWASSGHGLGFLIALGTFFGTLVSLMRFSAYRIRKRLHAFATEHHLDRNGMMRIYQLAFPATIDIDRVMDKLGF